MNNEEKAIFCGEVAHYLLTNKVIIRDITHILIIRSIDDLHDAIITDEINYGIASVKTGNKILILPKFIAIDDIISDCFVYLILRFISIHTCPVHMEIPALPEPKIVVKPVKRYHINNMIQKIKERFCK